MTGLILAGPLLTMAGARLMARRSTRPATLIAARRLADNPKAGFRAISGIMLALFITSVASGVITTIVANRGPQAGGAQAGNLSNLFRDPAPPDTAVPAGLAGVPGVRAFATVREPPRTAVADGLPGRLPAASARVVRGHRPDAGLRPCASPAPRWPGCGPTCTGPRLAGGAR